MARSQFVRPAYARRYSLMVDTSLLNPLEAALQIRDCMNAAPGRAGREH